MSPLPAELWILILKLSDVDPFRLIGVCKAWRTIGMTTPEIWSHIRIDGANHFAELTPTLLKFQRSDNVPLDVTFALPYQLTPTANSILAKVLLLLHQHISRLRSLDITAATFHLSECLSSIGQEKAAPLLEKLALNLWQDDTGTTNDHVRLSNLQSVFESTPRLIHITLPIHSTPVLSTTMRDTVTSLSLKHGKRHPPPNAERISGIFLDQLPHLEVLTVEAYECNRIRPSVTRDSPRAIAMPQLQTLVIPNQGWTLDVVRVIDASNLKSVVLFGSSELLSESPTWDDDGRADLYTTVHILSERSQHVKHLELRNVEMSATSTMQDSLYAELVDGLFPMLESLRFDGCDVGIVDIEAFKLDRSPIQRLEFVDCHDIPGTTLLKAFKQVTTSLKGFQLVVQGCSDVTQRHADGLSELMNVEWSSTRDSRRRL